MKAALLKNYGGPEQFEVKDIEAPSIQDGEILVKNSASSVNPVDMDVRQGKLRLMTGFTGGQVIGSDFSGTVIASKSSRFRKGEEVFGVLNAMKGGAYSELLVANEENAAIKPSNISFAEAASLAMVSLTAWQGMVYDGNLKQGNKVLILGCTGGVGSAAVQIAKSFGVQVTGTCSEKHMDYAKMLGCDRERTNPTSLVVRAISGEFLQPQLQERPSITLMQEHSPEGWLQWWPHMACIISVKV